MTAGLAERAMDRVPLARGSAQSEVWSTTARIVLTDPAALPEAVRGRSPVRWFDLSGTADPDYRSDFRVGGAESFRTPAGTSPRFMYDAEYRDIVDGERIVTTYEMTVDGQRTSVSVATVDLTPTASGTHLVYTEQGAYLDELDHPQSRRTGTTSQIESLATVLADEAS